MKNNKSISSRQILLLFVCLLNFVLSWHNCLADDSMALRFYKGQEPTIGTPKHPALHGTEGVIVKHRYGYSIGFSTVVCQSVWVAYKLTVMDLESGDKNNFDRRSYVADPDLRKYFVMSTAWPAGSFDHGHLAPCDDMKFSETAFKESFYMSNICPQNKYLNRGKWRECEKKLHNALSKDPTINPEGPLAEEIYIITGPIYSKSKIEKYLKEKKYNAQAIIIPDSFYKISIMNHVMTFKIFSQNGDEDEVTLEEIEKLTGLKFFPDF